MPEAGDKPDPPPRQEPPEYTVYKSRPSLRDRIRKPDKSILVRFKPSVYRRAVKPETADQVAAILVSPLGWVYYLPLAYGPILGWLGAGEHWSGLRRLRPPVLWLLVAGLALLYTPQEVANAATHSALATLTLTSVYFWATVTLWSVLCSNLET